MHIVHFGTTKARINSLHVSVHKTKHWINSGVRRKTRRKLGVKWPWKLMERFSLNLVSPSKSCSGSNQAPIEIYTYNMC